MVPFSQVTAGYSSRSTAVACENNKETHKLKVNELKAFKYRPVKQLMQYELR